MMVNDGSSCCTSSHLESGGIQYLICTLPITIRASGLILREQCACKSLVIFTNSCRARFSHVGLVRRFKACRFGEVALIFKLLDKSYRSRK
jgi:hypothetical protein